LSVRGLDLRLLEGDITDIGSLEKAVKGQDYLIHAAAHIIYWHRLSEIQNRINIDGTKNVIDLCRQHNIKRLLFVSSVSAIGIPSLSGYPANEMFEFNLSGSPLNYHISKYRAEEEIQKAAADGLDSVIVNPGTIFGPYKKGFRGGWMIKKVLKSRIVPYFLGGINIVHVDDVVDGILMALEKGKCGERYILGGENITYRRIAETAARHLGMKRTFVPLPHILTWLASFVFEAMGKLTGKHPHITYDTHYLSNRHQFYDSAKAMTLFQYNPRPFDSILRECIQFAENNKSL
jgi:dihydroflavonol-4-reductase